MIQFHRRIESWRQRVALYAVVMEAALYVFLARVALRLFAFRQLAWFFELPAKQPELAGPERERVRKEVQRAIKTVLLRLPEKTTCFARAIAAQAMLRRRGVATTLYYGAANLPNRGLATHVWLQDGNHGIVGMYAARDYHVLARYPDRPSAIPNSLRSEL